MTDIDQLAKPAWQIVAERDEVGTWARHVTAQQLNAPGRPRRVPRLAASEPDPPPPVQDPQPCDHDDQPAPIRRPRMVTAWEGGAVNWALDQPAPTVTIPLELAERLRSVVFHPLLRSQLSDLIEASR